MRLVILIAVIGLFMTGCIPDPLPVTDINRPADKIVIASQLIPGTGLVVFVTKSVGALEAGWRSDPEELVNEIAISNAIVKLKYNDIELTFDSLGTGFYSLNKTDFVPNLTYNLEVETPELGAVTASTMVADHVPFSSVDVQLFKMTSDSILQVDYSLNDPAGKNFYMVNVQKYSQKFTIQNLLNPRIFTRLNDDTSFDGHLFQDEFRTLFQRFSKGDTIAVTMSNVSEEFYKFLKLRNDRYRFSEFSSEPFNYPSNVKGGYGYFNLHTLDVRIFVVE